MELNRIFGDDPSEIEVGIQDPSLGKTGCPDINAYPAQCGRLVIAMDPVEDIGLARDENSDGSGEDDDVSDGVIIADDVDSNAGEVLLAGVAAGVDVLANEGVLDVGLMAAAYKDAIGSELGDVTIVYGGTQGIKNGDATTSEIGVNDEVVERDMFVGY